MYQTPQRLTPFRPTLFNLLAETIANGLTPETLDYNDPYYDLSAVDWIQHEFYVPELDGPIVLYPHQIAALNEALSVDENGLLKYDLVLWSDIKKSAKSTIAGAVVLWRCVHTKKGKFRIVANDLKQAASRVFEAITICLDLNPRLGEQFTRTKYQLTHIPTGSTIEAVPVDPKGEAGGGDDMVEFTELHSADNDAARKMWTETTLSPLKFGKSQRWIDTYAGFSGESPILEPLYTELVQEQNCIHGTSYPFYASGRAFCMWNSTPRLPWQTEEYYSSEARTLLPNEYRRVHKNEWTSSVQSFVQIEWWDACQVDNLPPIGNNEVVISLDAAVSNDCFAMVVLSRQGDNTVLRYARKWSPVNGKILYRSPDAGTGPDKDTEYPEGMLRHICERYNVVIVVYDEFQLHSFCSALAIEGIAAFQVFKQDSPRLVADKLLYDCIRDRRILHNGDFGDMREHIANANSTAEDKDKLRIIKRSQDKKIDLCVALSMCNERALRYLPE